ncbi:hypothetical protein [Reyranella soli]|uniref:Lipocalin-like domain-containing protein n=1 Tax=Reyranella soli TaxID=1230389 RepID=A0A512NKS5_9HYPH|nr:hypothetical protein [Reyranella soli]GEP59532.1 hypothetical protein RSO01_66980 [Reyranella soli]
MRLLATLALLVLAVSASAQTKPPLPVSDLAGEWHGQWTAPTGYLFTATLSLKVAPDGIADGQFVWTLKSSPLAEEQRKLGMSAIEFVSGKVDSAAGTVSLAGTRKDDPNDVIFTDRYRLVVGENGRTLGGVSRNLGDWDGLIFLQR